MSIPVELTELAEALTTYRFGYLLTVSDDGRPHAVAVRPEWRDRVLVTGTGRRTAANAAARPNVSLVFPPAEEGGYSLIVDATATVGDPGTDHELVALAPQKAVLHRPAPAGTPVEPGTCGADCIPLGTATG